MRYLSGDTANHDHEVDEAAWFDVRAAKKALKYVNEKRLIDHALEHIATLEYDPIPLTGPQPVPAQALAELLVGESTTR
jgi:hypothetical protein